MLHLTFAYSGYIAYSPSSTCNTEVFKDFVAEKHTKKRRCIRKLSQNNGEERVLKKEKEADNVKALEKKKQKNNNVL